MQICAAGDGEAERLQQFGGLGLLQDVAARAGAQRLARVLGVLAHRQDRDRHRRVRHEARGQGAEAGAARHRQVQRQQVGLVLTHRPDQGRDVGRFGDDLELAFLAFEDGADAVAHDRVVIGDDDRRRTAWCGWCRFHARKTVALRTGPTGGVPTSVQSSTSRHRHALAWPPCHRRSGQPACAGS